ncbi:MAG: CocE/NonD family hydrolase [Paracoccaceae bacterium]
MATIRTDFPHPVEIVENVFVPMPDGTRLAAKLWRPTGAGPVPAILEYLPYRKREGTRARDQKMHAWLAGHGYACIRLDIRGTGDSEGLIDDEYTAREQEDGVAAIAWIAAQDWCDGQVAMYGISWGGFNGLQIAARQPPALKTIITVGSTDDRYATDVHYVGGCLSKDNFDWSATMFAHNDLPPDPQIVGERWREMWMARIRHNSPWILPWLTHQRRDTYWKQGSVCEDFDAITIPVLAVSGWADNYSESVARLLAGLSGPRLGLVGPWAHSFPHDVAVHPAIGWLQEVRRWCDHWLKGVDNGVMDAPVYRVWMQESVPPATCYLNRPGRWVAEAAWPSPRIEARHLHLNSGGTLDAEPGASGRAAISSPLWVGLASGEVGRYGEDAEWPPDQREDDGGSLVFLSEPLTERTEILGAPALRLTVYLRQAAGAGRRAPERRDARRAFDARYAGMSEPGPSRQPRTCARARTRA